MIKFKSGLPMLLSVNVRRLTTPILLCALLILSRNSVGHAASQQDVQSAALSYIDCVGDLENSNKNDVRAIVAKAISSANGGLTETTAKAALLNVLNYSRSQCGSKRISFTRILESSDYDDKIKVVSIVEDGAQELFMGNFFIVMGDIQRNLSKRIK